MSYLIVGNTSLGFSDSGVCDGIEFHDNGIYRNYSTPIIQSILDTEATSSGTTTYENLRTTSSSTPSHPKIKCSKTHSSDMFESHVDSSHKRRKLSVSSLLPVHR